MNQFEQSVNGWIIPPAAILHSASATILNTGTSVEQGSAAAVSINCAGYNFLVVRICIGATDGITTAFKLQESAAANMSSPSDITGAVYGTSPAPALPGISSDNTVHEFYVDLANTNRKQYIAPVVTMDGTGSGGFITASYSLHKQSAPLAFDDASRGVTDHVSV